MVDLLFSLTSAYRPSPEGAQIPKNGNYTRFPWALIILRKYTATYKVVLLCAQGKHAHSDHTGYEVRPTWVWVQGSCLLGHGSNLLTKPISSAMKWGHWVINMNLSLWLTNEEMYVKHITWEIVSVLCIVRSTKVLWPRHQQAFAFSWEKKIVLTPF